MIQFGTNLKVVDNTGAKMCRCIKILGATRARYAHLGQVIVVSIKDAS
ncbi:uL14 family ribosomal protein, partial [Candidatus Peregrinibacteria bacterium]|nr:uL14 family ribosomal protein [Candidatus Peregrinibacteria bacterium]